MNDIVLYVKESYNELLHNVTWPTWSDLLRNSRIVIVATILIAAIIFIMDFIAKLLLLESITLDSNPTLTKKSMSEETTRWYSLRVISGKEKKIKERIELEITRNKWADFIPQILVPSEKVYKIRKGKKVILERNILPGYILIEAVPGKFSGEMITTISGMPNVIHFLGKNNPIPMRQAEANRMLGKVDESQEVSEAMIEPYIVGETVKVVDGPFNEFVGDVLEVNEEKKKLKVIVKIFGRGTEVELNFMQVEKT